MWLSMRHKSESWWQTSKMVGLWIAHAEPSWMMPILKNLLVRAKFWLLFVIPVLVAAAKVCVPVCIYVVVLVFLLGFFFFFVAFAAGGGIVGVVAPPALSSILRSAVFCIVCSLWPDEAKQKCCQHKHGFHLGYCCQGLCVLCRSSPGHPPGTQC